MRDTEVKQTFMVDPCVNLIIPIDFKLHTYINFGKKKKITLKNVYRILKDHI